MLALLPLSRETIVSSYEAQQLSERLWNVTEPTRSGEWMPDVRDEALYFNGWVKKEHFKLSRKVSRANNFLPMISGKIESSSMGSIVFIRYRLFMWTLSFLIFWSVLTGVFALYFFIYERIYINAIFSLLLGVANYVIAILNFHKQVKLSSRILHEVLE
ncbi:hypothetical protein OKW21_005682 [Catalinimonas alkaloidigena]|uniref:hypothetical protein n=1 Tax=Catalinimonas alkaloidigena TaxID=1075417 RepID=UPI0024067309|nr:hypothetical protein [Catalinimonas alkaloidigena]MDF9800419.1 hypothetical protein [Catalinimonas alkaloidigena]